MLLAVSLQRVGALATGTVPPPNPQALIEGFWEGTERCAEHCCSAAHTTVSGSDDTQTQVKPHCQGTVRATLSFGPGGNGTYSIDGLVMSSEYRGDFASGRCNRAREVLRTKAESACPLPQVEQR